MAAVARATSSSGRATSSSGGRAASRSPARSALGNAGRALSSSASRSPTRSPTSPTTGARGAPMTQRQRARRAAEEAAKKEEEERKKKREEDEAKAKARLDNPFIPSLPLVAAVIENNVGLVKELIWAQPIDSRLEFVNAYDKDGQTALFHTMGPDHLPMMQVLLDYGADANARNDQRNTPLHAACLALNKKGIRLLIYHGADLLAQNFEYHRPHQLVDGAAAQAQYQTYLNACLSAMTERVKEKKWPLCNRQQRCYYRSMFDILDTKHVDVLPFKELLNFLGTLKEGQVELPEEKGVVEWFKSMDSDRNGVLTFTEWLSGVMTYVSFVEKQRRRAALRKRRKSRKKKSDDEKKKATPIWARGSTTTAAATTAPAATSARGPPSSRSNAAPSPLPATSALSARAGSAGGAPLSPSPASSPTAL